MTFVALVVAAVVVAVVIGALAADAQDPGKALVNGLGAQIASLAVIVFVLRRYGLRRERLGLDGIGLRVAVPLVVGAVVAGEAVYLLFDALVGTPEEASAARF